MSPNKYFSRIEDKEDRSKRRKRGLKNTAALAGSVIVPTAVATAASIPALNIHLNKGGRYDFNSIEEKNSHNKLIENLLVDRFEKDPKLRVNTEVNNISAKVGDHYNMFDHQVNLVPKDNKLDAYALAHELGHSHMGSKNKADRIPKYIQKSTAIGSIPAKLQVDPVIGVPVNFLMGANAFDSGYKARKDKNQGKKTNWFRKNKAWIVPAVPTALMLANEAHASINGLNALKRAGADANQIRDARKVMGGMYGSYVAGAALNSVSPLLGYQLGKMKADRDLRRGKYKSKEELDKI